MLVEKINVNKKTICLRAETKANEYRTPLVPKDAAKLLKKNCRVLVPSLISYLVNILNQKELHFHF